MAGDEEKVSIEEIVRLLYGPGHEFYLAKKAELAPLIGEFVIEFSQLEDYLACLLASYLGVQNGSDYVGWIVVRRNSFVANVGLLDELIHEKLENPRQAVYEEAERREKTELIGELRALNDFRNVLIHARYRFINVGGALPTLPKVRKGKMRVDAPPYGDPKVIVGRIEDTKLMIAAVRELSDWFDRIGPPL